MRSISTEILEKIQKLNQTIYEDADPRMDVSIEVVGERLDLQEIYSPSASEEEEDADSFDIDLGIDLSILNEILGVSMAGEALPEFPKKTDIAGRREDPDKGVTELFAIAIINGIAVVFKSYAYSPKYPSHWFAWLSLGQAEDVAAIFDGYYVYSSLGSGSEVFVTEGEPLFFWLDNSVIYSKRGKFGTIQTVMDSPGITSIAAIRGWSPLYDPGSIFTATITAETEEAVTVPGAQVFIVKAQKVNFTVEEVDGEPISGATISIQQTLQSLPGDDQGIVLSYIQDGTAYIRMSRRAGMPWSEPYAIDMPEDLLSISVFRAEDHRLGFVAAGERQAYISISDPYGLQTKLIKNVNKTTNLYYEILTESRPYGVIGADTISAAMDGNTLRLFFIRAGKIMCMDIEVEDWNPAKMETVRIETLLARETAGLCAADLYEGELFFVYYINETVYMGQESVPVPENLEVSGGTITLRMDTPVVSATLDVENLPERLPQVSKPVWDGDAITWIDVLTNPEDIPIPEYTVEFEITDGDLDVPLENAEIFIRKEY